MNLKIDIDPDIVALMKSRGRGRRARCIGRDPRCRDRAQEAWRTQITGAGLGARLARPSGRSSSQKANQASTLRRSCGPKAPVIVGVHDTGPMIRSKTGFWLAIPTQAAGKIRAWRRISPENGNDVRAEATVRLRRRGPSLLVAEGRLNTAGRAVVSGRKRAGAL